MPPIELKTSTLCRQEKPSEIRESRNKERNSIADRCDQDSAEMESCNNDNRAMDIQVDVTANADGRTKNGELESTANADGDAFNVELEERTTC